MKITQKRVEDRIEFYAENENLGGPIASLFDQYDHIIFNDVAVNGTRAILGKDELDLAAEFQAIGLDVETARLVDAMPNRNSDI